MNILLNLIKFKQGFADIYIYSSQNSYSNNLHN